MTDQTVGGLVAAFMLHAATYYPQRRNRSSEVSNFRAAVAPLLMVYADLPMQDFGPLQLKAVRQLMIESGWLRSTINASCRRIRQVVSWAIGHQLLPSDQLTALKTVAGLRRGRSAAKDGEPVRPPKAGIVEATLPHLLPVHVAIINLLRLTGARADEICPLRGEQIDRTESEWRYEPTSHKTAYLGRSRVIWFGADSQAILTGWLRPGPMFTDPLRRRPYNSKTLAKVIERAIKKHNLPHWHLHMLRHERATEIDRLTGSMDMSQAMLGHARIETTGMYCDRMVRLAREGAAKFG